VVSRRKPPEIRCGPRGYAKCNGGSARCKIPLVEGHPNARRSNFLNSGYLRGLRSPLASDEGPTGVVNLHYHHRPTMRFALCTRGLDWLPGNRPVDHFAACASQNRRRTVAAGKAVADFSGGGPRWWSVQACVRDTH
jgi:hypothetical protein